MGVKQRKHLEISSLQLFGQTAILPSGKMLGRQETVMFSQTSRQPITFHPHQPYILLCRTDTNKKLIRGVEELRIVLFPPKYALWSSARADTNIREALITPPPAAAPINGNKWPRVKPCWGGVTQVRQNPRFPGYLQGHVTRVPPRA